MTVGPGRAVDLRGRFRPGVRSFVGRHHVGCYLSLAVAIFWASKIPGLFFAVRTGAAHPLPHSAPSRTCFGRCLGASRLSFGWFKPAQHKPTHKDQQPQPLRQVRPDQRDRDRQ